MRISDWSSDVCSSDLALAAMAGKRLGLVLASEEAYPGVALGIVHQIQEFSRYTNSDFVGVVRGAGNSRGEVRNDPANPVGDAERLGRELFSRSYSDYRLERSEEHTSELQSLMRISYAVFCLKKKKSTTLLINTQ